MSCSTILRFLFLVSVALFPLGLVNARPANSERYNVYPREAASLGSPTTLMTVQTSQAVVGPMTQICTVTLTPITDANGNSAVQEVTSCTETTDANGGSLGNSQAPSASPSTTGASSSTASADPSADISSPSTTSSSTTSASPSTAVPSLTTDSSSSAVTSSNSINSSFTISSSTLPSGAAIPITTLGIIPSGSVSHTVTSASTQSTSAALPSPAVAGASAGNGSKAAATGINVASSAAGVTTTPESSFSLPGKHLSVLPIGLGVFAGISVIALIIVGLVTYERTKYRKAFRQRKLAEAGTAMGYGGMAQRTP